MAKGVQHDQRVTYPEQCPQCLALALARPPLIYHASPAVMLFFAIFAISQDVAMCQPAGRDREIDREKESGRASERE